ncbi:MAG: J domain-containing protein [Pseudomonadota bacterium]
MQGDSARGGSVVAIVGSTRALKKIQRRFNKWLRFQDQRRELAHWKAFQQEFQERIACDYHPLTTQLRQKQVAMARLFDRTLDGNGLGSLQRRKVFEIFSSLVQNLLADEHDEELVQLYDKYAEVSFAEERQDEVDALSGYTSQAFGIDTQDYTGGADPQELAAWISDQIGGGESDPEPSPRRQRKSAASGAAPWGAKAAESGTRALREVFRKLVSELHPDREANTAERARQIDLMKEVNRAHAAGDLLRLLRSSSISRRSTLLKSRIWPKTSSVATSTCSKSSRDSCRKRLPKFWSRLRRLAALPNRPLRTSFATH